MQGKTISLFSFKTISGIELKGFRYQLPEKNFPEGFYSLSNVIEADIACVNFKNGTVIIYVVN